MKVPFEGFTLVNTGVFLIRVRPLKSKASFFNYIRSSIYIILGEHSKSNVCIFLAICQFNLKKGFDRF